jgi:uncharacterized surface protein with fasciclin (FAS1) repeats
MTALGSSSFIGLLMVDPSPWTIFVPTNKAFDKFDEQGMRDFLSNTAALDQTISSHAVRGSMFKRGFTW